MTPPQDDTNGSDYDLQPERDEYAISEPQEPARHPGEEVPQHLKTHRVSMVTADSLPPPPRLPMVTGVFSFPWYLHTLVPWLAMSTALTLAAEATALCFWLVDQGLGIAARCFALPTCCLIYLATTYSSACCLTVVQQTSEGCDQVEDWPTGDWREWFWSLKDTGAMFIIAGLIGYAVWALTRLWLPAAAVVLLLYPIMFLSWLESASPVSLPVLRSLRTTGRAWGFFYAVSAVLLAGWTIPSLARFPEQPFLTILVSMPLLAAVLLVYARLLGRLAWCIGETEEESPEDE